jgi:hypothetical protein
MVDMVGSLVMADLFVCSYTQSGYERKEPPPYRISRLRGFDGA